MILYSLYEDLMAAKTKLSDRYKAFKAKKELKMTPSDLLSNAEEDPKYMGIYMIYVEKSDMAYIGQSTNIPIRWKNHKKDLKEKKHHNLDLQRLWNKHRGRRFTFVVLEYCSEKELEKKEQYWINQLDSKFCLNKEVTCVPTKEVGEERKSTFKELLELMSITFNQKKDYFEVQQLDGTWLIYYPETGRWKAKGKDKLYFSKSGAQFINTYVLKKKKW